MLGKEPAARAAPFVPVVIESNTRVVVSMREKLHDPDGWCSSGASENEYMLIGLTAEYDTTPEIVAEPVTLVPVTGSV